MKLLGVVMAGGRNMRFGGLKALEPVGGRRIIDRVIGALELVTDDVVMIANDMRAYGAMGVPMRADATTEGGPLAGLLTALNWSAERKCDGIMTVACDMPFPSTTLLRRIAEVAEREHADVAAPESGGRRGIEPLCAFYANRCATAIEQAIARNDLRMISFHDDVRVARVPLADVRQIGDPAVLFMNVNTPDELEKARAIAEAERL